MLIAPGKLMALVFFLATSIITLIVLYLGKIGKIRPTLRKIPALDAIEESVSRCTEMGRPVLFSLGQHSDVSTTRSLQVMASFDVLHYVIREAAKRETPVLACVGKGEAFPLLLDVAHSAYMAEGRPELFDPNNFFWWGDDYYSYYAGLTDVMYDYRPASVMLIGPISWENVACAVDISKIGAEQISYGDNISHAAFAAVSSDYFLITEEIFAASAYLTKDPLESSCIFGQDISKIVFLIFVVIGFIATAAGVPIVKNLFGV